jgi:phosphatidylserine/phosphatidylglycerophosphate/cardiolipin synthase-like enzyme
MSIVTASRASVLIDASEYFARLADALKQAEHSIFIIGWDFDGRIKLCPDQDGCPALGPFLRSLVEAKPSLEIRILVWSLAVVHAPGAPLPLLVGAPWQDHPRISLRLDREHPLYASHHQKIVCIDDSLAFVGGIDLTVRRWDTCRHDEELSHRVDPAGAVYTPVHDVQMLCADDAARGLATVARDRWYRISRCNIPYLEQQRDLWPKAVTPAFSDSAIGIARTAPAWRGIPAIEEIARLTIDMFSEARKTIYVEAQYLTSRLVRQWMERSLASREGPEIVIILKRTLPGIFERLVMGGNRDRMLRRLRRADRHNRLRVYYPVVSGRQGSCEVLVHAKILIIDNKILRVGSSNLNNRSMGLDTECDVVIEAEADEEHPQISMLRDRLLAEHLDTSPAAVSAAVRCEGSLIHAIERLNHGERGLRPFPETRLGGPLHSIAGTWLLDPPGPIEPLWWRLKMRKA